MFWCRSDGPAGQTSVSVGGSRPRGRAGDEKWASARHAGQVRTGPAMLE